MPGLFCAHAVRWLLDNEPDLRERIGKYAAGLNNWHTIPFALPAPAEEMAKHRKNRDKYKLMFPNITLRLKRVKHPETGELGVEVTCSDPDMDAIIRMARETHLRKEIAKAPALN